MEHVSMYGKKTDVRKIVTLAMLAGLAYLVMFVGRIPMVLFLKYDPKDIVILIGGFLFGALPALAMSVTVSFIEMVTVSSDGWIGFIMNVVATCAFVCPAAVIYKRNHTLKGAIIGVVAGWLLMTGVMLLWNYFLTPIYMGLPRADIAAMLIPTFLPFNLLKGGINAAVTMLIYKPVTAALNKSGLIPKSQHADSAAGKLNVGVLLLSGFVLVTCILLTLVIRGII